MEFKAFFSYYFAMVSFGSIKYRRGRKDLRKGNQSKTSTLNTLSYKQKAICYPLSLPLTNSLSTTIGVAPLHPVFNSKAFP